jgi:hypothetical protein
LKITGHKTHFQKLEMVIAKQRVNIMAGRVQMLEMEPSPDFGQFHLRKMAKANSRIRRLTL